MGTLELMLESPFIAAVSDGVSGELSGELASRRCLEMLREVKYSSEVNLHEKILEIHKMLAECGSESSETLNMQATLCGFAVDENDNMSIINVGDSRLYRYRGGKLRQMSRDQSLVQLLYEEGRITDNERRTHVHRNIIFPVMGNVNSVPKIDIIPVEGGMQYGDVLLLCTDGISDYVSRICIEEILELPMSMPKRMKRLSDMAIENGSKDNITAVAVTYC
jgi:protein phosphatase